MLDGLRTADDGRVQHLLVIDLAGDIVGFPDQAIDRRAVGALRIPAKALKDLLEAADLLFGLGQMIAQAGRKFPVGCLLDHLRQRLHDLVFCVIHVLQGVEEKVPH